MAESNNLLKNSNKNFEKNTVTIYEKNLNKSHEKRVESDGDKNRGLWSSKTEFLLSCIGYAIGLGNVWRFPYLCYRNGGGAFLIPYFVTLLTCGIPLYFLEMGLGQFSNTGCVGIFRLAPLLKGTGLAILIINFLCTCYCSVILSYPILFIMKLFTSPLPWMTCNNKWNTNNCVVIEELSHQNFTQNSTLKTAADEFFHYEILKISPGIEQLGGIVWPLFACLVISWLVLYLCIMKGIKSVGKVVYFSATFPFIVLIGLFIRGITLPGAADGILFYMSPDWSRLLDIKVWSDAALQIFFSLGPGWGGIVNMASFNNFRNNIKKDVLLIPLINCSTSIFAGFVVFSVLGYLSHETGIPIKSVVTAGPGLVFIIYPQAIAMMPWPYLWATLFFAMIFLLGLDTVFVQIETIAACVLDEIPKIRKYKYLIPIVLCGSMFLISIVMVTHGGMYVLQLLDWYSNALPLILICFLEVIMVSWIYGIKNFNNDINFMIGSRPHVIISICLKYITPVVLISLFIASVFFNGRITYGDKEYPDWAVGLGWCSCAISIVFIPLYMIYILFFKSGSSSKNLKINLKAQNWLPASQEYREDYQAYKCLFRRPSFGKKQEINNEEIQL